MRSRRGDRHGFCYPCPASRPASARAGARPGGGRVHACKAGQKPRRLAKLPCQHLPPPRVEQTGFMSCLRATALTGMSPDKLSITISRFRSIDQMRRRSARAITRIRGPRAAIRSVAWLIHKHRLGDLSRVVDRHPAQASQPNRVPQCVAVTPLTTYPTRTAEEESVERPCPAGNSPAGSPS